jgi:hypothetical protein
MRQFFESQNHTEEIKNTVADNHTEEEKGISHLIAQVKVGGSPNLSSVSDEDKQRILSWYRHNEVSPQDKVDFLEEFIRYGLVDDSEARSYVIPMGDEQKEQLGEYIGRTVNPKEYVQTFYECFPCISYEAAAEMYRGIKDHPETAILFAPFNHIARIRTGLTYTDEMMRKQALPFLEYAFSDPEEASNLIASIVKYYDEHIRTPERAAIESVVYFYHNHPHVLFPHLIELHRLKFLSKDEINRLCTEKLFKRDFMTQKDVERVEVLMKELGYNGRHDWLDVSTARPRQKALEIQRIKDDANVLATKYLFRNFKENHEYFSLNTTEFLDAMLSRTYAVFTSIEELGLSKEEVRTYLVQCFANEGVPFWLWGYGDMKALLEWNNKVNEGPDLENLIIQMMGGVLQDGERNKGRMGEIIPWFRPENQQKIITAINQRSPEVWISNLSYAIKNKVLPLEEIILRASESIPKTFLEQLNRIQYHIHEYQKAGIETPNIEHVKKLAKKTFLEYPVFFFNKKYINIVEELFTEEERSTFVQNQLDKTPVNVDLLLTVLFSEQFSTYKTQLHALLIKDEKLFLKVFEERYIFSTGVISLSEMVTFIINNLGTVSLAINFDATFIQPLLEDEEELERLLAAFVKANDAPNLALLINVIRSIEHLSYNIPANWRKEIKKTEEALEIRLRDRRQSSHDDLGFVEIEKDIEDLRDTLDRLKKTKPDEEKVWQTHTVAKERKHTLVTGLRNLCEQEKFAVFDEDVMCALGESAKDFILRDIEEYVSLYPNILLTHTSNKLRNGFPNSEGLFFRKILGDELFIKLFSSKIRTLAHFTEKNGRVIDPYGIPEELHDQVGGVNIIFAFKLLHKNSWPQKDFYAICIERAQRSGFYPLYAKRLNKIAKKEVDMYGVQVSIEDHKINQEFAALLRVISLLDDSPIVQHNREHILALPEKQQEELIAILEPLILNHLDTTIEFDLGSDEYAHVREMLLAHLLTFNKKVFELDHMNQGNSELLSVRSMNALSIYYNNSCRKLKNMKSVFQTTVSHVLSGDYITWRAWGTEVVPKEEEKGAQLRSLKHQKLLPEHMTPKQYEKWVEEAQSTMSETFTFESSDIRSGISDILSLAAVDGHIDQSDISFNNQTELEYENIKSPIRLFSERQQELKAKMSTKKGGPGLSLDEEEEYKNLKQKIIDYKQGHDSRIKFLEAVIYLHQLKKIDRLEIEKQSLYFGRKMVPFAVVFKTLEEAFSGQQDFISDITRIRNLIDDASRHILDQASVSRSELVITDRVDFETYLCIGEKPVDSCQHYNGTDNNHGLLAYLSDPAVKIVQMYNEEGTIIARAVLRIMEDKDGNPQLFMERIYSTNNHPKVREAILGFCKKKAEALNVTLYSSENQWVLDDTTTSTAPTTLFSRGSRSPFVYTDAGGGKVPYGIFKIEV